VAVDDGFRPGSSDGAEPVTHPERGTEARPSAGPDDVTTELPLAVTVPGEIEPGPQPVPEAPVTARGGNAGRWGVALLVTAAILAITGVGLVFLSTAAPASTTVGYVPPESFGYLEVRLDAPGDQRQNLANVLSAFPGFADTANLGFKIDEAGDLLLGQAAPGAGQFSRDIHPWLGDSLALVATRLPSTPDASDAGGLLLIATKDPAAASAYVRTFVAPNAPTTSYGGVQLSELPADDQTLLVGIVGNVLIAGDEESVRSAIDTRGSSSFVEGATYQEAIAGVTNDRLAFGYLDLRRVAVGMLAQAAQTPQPSGPFSVDALPSWVSLVIRAESDAMTATLALPGSNLSPTNADRASTLAPALPATTLAQVEAHDLGDLILSGLTAFRETPEGRATMEQVDQALRALGGAEELVGWIGDGSVALLSNGTELPDAGLLIRAKDAEQATERLVQLRNLVSLLGGSAGITIGEETHHEVPITLYDVGPVELLGDTPPPIAVGERLVVAVAQRDDLVIVGIGAAFVREVLDTAPGQSLASTERYAIALDRAGESNAGQLYVDIVRLLEVAVAALPAEDQAFYRREIAPYLEPLQAGAASVSAGDRLSVRLVVTVQEPGR
jgi:hypothetical protein